MGEAKRKKAARYAALRNLKQCDIARVATALRKFALSCSTAVGADCYTYAAHGQQLLARLGIQADIAVGYAAWRVGDGDYDVIGHTQKYVSAVMLPSGGYMYHAWLLVAGRILDFTTHLLRHKAAMLDAADGHRTTVKWCPDYLFAEKDQVSTFSAVRIGHAGLFYYERVAEIEAKARAEALPPPQEEIEALWRIYQHPDIEVIGPNDINVKIIGPENCDEAYADLMRQFGLTS